MASAVCRHKFFQHGTRRHAGHVAAHGDGRKHRGGTQGITNQNTLCAVHGHRGHPPCSVVVIEGDGAGLSDRRGGAQGRSDFIPPYPSNQSGGGTVRVDGMGNQNAVGAVDVAIDDAVTQPVGQSVKLLLRAWLRDARTCIAATCPY